ncbi:MAG: dynamin family protein [Arenicellales bacterium]
MSYFEEQLNADQSLRELRQLIESIYGWMEKNRFHSHRTVERFEHVRTSLDDKHRNVLFLAEFSRGKSELINATIFGDQGSRMLPSSPGRTTRCTTVLQYEQGALPSIKLLPTRSSEGTESMPVSMLLKDEAAWHSTLFSLSDKAQAAEAFKQIAEAELVSSEIARSLGFVDDIEDEGLVDVINGQIPIPKWRHAIINYPHSLLKQGLRIIDTPGLNALGVEPELTLQALESAHAIVFVLSADTGVTRSELELWRDYVREGNKENIIIVLNKIDLLWDELKSRVEIDHDVKKQIKDVSRILGIPKEQVFPVSAQKAMLGRARDDQKLIKASGIQRYEQALADTINFTNQRRIVGRAIDELSPTLGAIRSVLKRRINDTAAYIDELQGIHENQISVAQVSLQKVKRDVRKHNRARKRINALKLQLREGYTRFVRRLDLVYLDRMIASYRYEISNQLTTPGLQREMNDFHVAAIERFKKALSYMIRLEKKISHTFKEVEKTLDVDGLTVRKIDPEIYIDSLKKFQASHNEHSTGLGMIMTEQHILRDRYHGAVMSRIRNLYKQTRDDVDRWCRTVLVPLELELKDRANEIKRRHASLERVYNKDSKLQDEISDLEAQLQQYRQRLTTMEHFLRRLSECGELNTRYPGNVINLHPPAATSKSA